MVSMLPKSYIQAGVSFSLVYVRELENLALGHRQNWTALNQNVNLFKYLIKYDTVSPLDSLNSSLFIQ